VHLLLHSTIVHVDRISTQVQINRIMVPVNRIMVPVNRIMVQVNRIMVQVNRIMVQVNRVMEEEDAVRADVAPLVHQDSLALTHPMDYQAKSVTLEHPDQRPVTISNKHQLQINVHARLHRDHKDRMDLEVHLDRVVTLVDQAAMVNQEAQDQWDHQANLVVTAIPELEVNQARLDNKFKDQAEHQAHQDVLDRQEAQDLEDLPDHLAVTDNQAALEKWEDQAHQAHLDNQVEMANRVRAVAVVVTDLAITAHQRAWLQDTKNQSVGYRSITHSFQSHKPIGSRYLDYTILFILYAAEKIRKS